MADSLPGLMPSTGLCPRAQAPGPPSRHATLAPTSLHPTALFAAGASHGRARGSATGNGSSSVRLSGTDHTAADRASSLSSRACLSQAAPAARLLCDLPLGPKPRAAARADLAPQATGSWGRTGTEGVGGTDHAMAGQGNAAPSPTPSPSSPLPASTQRSSTQHGAAASHTQVTSERERESDKERESAKESEGERERESLSSRAIRLSQSLRSDRLRAVDLHKIDASDHAPEPPLQALDALPMLTRGGGVHLRRQEPEPQGPEQRLERDNEALSARVGLGATPQSSLSFADLGFSPSHSSSSSSSSSSFAANSLAAGAATATAAATASSEPSSSRRGAEYASGVPRGASYRMMAQESNPSLRLLAAAQGPNAVQWLQASDGAPSHSTTSPTASGAYSAPTPFARSRTPGAPSAPFPPSGVVTAARAVSPGLAVFSGGEVDKVSSVNAATAMNSPGTSGGVSLDSGIGGLVEGAQGFTEMGDSGGGGQGIAPGVVTGAGSVTVTAADSSASKVHSPVLRKTVTKGAVTKVKLVRTVPGQEEPEATAAAQEEGEGEAKEGGGEEGGGGGEVTGTRRATGPLGGGEEAEEEGIGGYTEGEPALSTSTSASARARAEYLRSELAALEAGAAGEGGVGPVEVSAGDLDTVLGRLEVKYEVVDEVLVGGNVRTLMELGARGGQVMRVVAKQPGLLSRSIGEEAGALVGVLDSYQIRRSALLQGLGKSLDCLAVGAEQADGVLGFLDRQIGVNNLGKLVSTMPHILGQSLEELASTVELLREMDVPDIGAALERNPALLGRGAEDVRGKVEALEGLVKGKGAVRSMVHRCAPLMLATPEATKDTFSRLLRLLGEEEAIRIVTAQPQILATDADMVERAATQLMSHFGASATAAMLVENGSLVRRKWDATAAKLQFLQHEMGRSAGEVAAWPKALTYNLEARLRRRWKALQEQAPEGGEGEGALATLSLRSVFGCSDAVFERRFSVRLPVAALRKRGRKPAVKAEETAA